MIIKFSEITKDAIVVQWNLKGQRPLAQVPNVNLLIHLNLYSKAISINRSQFFGS